jgi:hypothetical protein
MFPKLYQLYKDPWPFPPQYYESRWKKSYYDNEYRHADEHHASTPAMAVKHYSAHD